MDEAFQIGVFSHAFHMNNLSMKEHHIAAVTSSKPNPPANQQALITDAILRLVWPLTRTPARTDGIPVESSSDHWRIAFVGKEIAAIIMPRTNCISKPLSCLARCLAAYWLIFQESR
jgi:hypothetical protein